MAKLVILFVMLEYDDVSCLQTIFYGGIPRIWTMTFIMFWFLSYLLTFVCFSPEEVC